MGESQAENENVTPVHVTFQKLSYSVALDGKNNKKKGVALTILDSLEGSFLSGKLTALMGPSGSGKTTLMDCLAGRKNTGSLDGTILFNGKAPTKDDYRFVVGYVEQFDTLVGELTVEQMLHYTSELKLSSHITKAERLARVEEVIRMLDLESCRHTVIGNSLNRGISGGQAKRVNIGLALMTRPPVLFLDEPTSGLDSRTANEVVELLRALAHDGSRTIVSTIHSPSGHAFSLFDELHMIHNGRTIYDGSVANVQTYFEGVIGHEKTPEASLPEWLVDLTSDMESLYKKPKAADEVALEDGSAAKTAPDATNEGAVAEEDGQASGRRSEFAELYQSSTFKIDVETRRSSELKAKDATITTSNRKVYRPPSQFSKMVTLLKYRAVAHYKDGEYLGSRFTEKFVYALITMALYWQIGSNLDPQSIISTSNLLFFITALCGFGASTFIPALSLERKLFYRELADGCYRPTTYFFAKFLEEAFVALFTSLLFCVIVYYGCALTGKFGIFFITYYLTTLIGVILAYAISAAIRSLDVANTLLPMYVTVCMYFGGLFIVFDKIPKGWLWFSWTSFMRYAWGAFMLNCYRESEAGTVAVFFDANGDSQTVLEFYALNAPIMGSIAACLALLATLFLFFFLVGILSLVYIRHEKR